MAENQLDSLSGEKSPPQSSCPADKSVFAVARSPEGLTVLLAGDNLTFVVAGEVGSWAAGGAATGSASDEGNRVSMILC